MRVALLQIPKIVQVAVGKNNEAAVLRLGVFARLFFADQRVLVLGLGFKYDERKTCLIKQQEIDETIRGSLKIFTECIDGGLCQFDLRLKHDVGFAFAVIEKTPASFFKQLVEFDASLGFFCGHLYSLACRSRMLPRSNFERFETHL